MTAPNIRPKIGYVSLWFPLASETFVFREAQDLAKEGLDIRVYSMYGKAAKGQSAEMANYGQPVKRYGIKAFFRILSAFVKASIKQPKKVRQLAAAGLFRKMRNMEALGENIWCFMAGFLLAEQCKADGIQLLHAAWANGPATAAWVAAGLLNIPFSFSGRAGDIYPEDGILREKCAAASFIRTNNKANIDWLASFCPKGQSQKIKLIYNGLTFRQPGQKRQHDPGLGYQLLAVGRFARTKGFPELLTAMSRLKRENVPVRLTLIGDGSWKKLLLKMRARLKLEDCVAMPGFVPNDQLQNYMSSHDLLVVPSVIHSNGDRDGIPNVIMEAGISSLPIVATDVCGISEVIKNGETGLLVPQRDPAALARAIRQMLEHPEQAAAMAANAEKLIRAMFDTEKNSRQLAQLYQSALENA